MNHILTALLLLIIAGSSGEKEGSKGDLGVAAGGAEDRPGGLIDKPADDKKSEDVNGGREEGKSKVEREEAKSLEDKTSSKTANSGSKATAEKSGNAEDGQKAGDFQEMPEAAPLLGSEYRNSRIDVKNPIQDSYHHANTFEYSEDHFAIGDYFLSPDYYDRSVLTLPQEVKAANTEEVKHQFMLLRSTINNNYVVNRQRFARVMQLVQQLKWMKQTLVKEDLDLLELLKVRLVKYFRKTLKRGDKVDEATFGWKVLGTLQSDAMSLCPPLCLKDDLETLLRKLNDKMKRVYPISEEDVYKLNSLMDMMSSIDLDYGPRARKMMESMLRRMDKWADLLFRDFVELSSADIVNSAERPEVALKEEDYFFEETDTKALKDNVDASGFVHINYEDFQ